MMGDSVSRREAIAGAGAASVAAIFPPVRLLTEAQQGARSILVEKISRNAGNLAMLKAIPDPTANDQVMVMLYDLIHDQAVETLAEFDRGEGIWWRLST